MKTLKYLFGFLFFVKIISSCVSVSSVSDDDVYVLKNPTLSSGEEINDESSYENYHFKRDKGIFNTKYTYVGLYFLNFGFGNYYSPYYHYYPYYDYPYFYGNYFNPYSFFCYDPYYGYGNPYYSYYNNPSNYKISYNFHKRPRNSISGINNSRRSSVNGMTGMILAPNSTNVFSSHKILNSDERLRRSNIMNTPSEKNIIKNRVSGKSITSGTTLSKRGVNISSQISSKRGGNSSEIRFSNEKVKGTNRSHSTRSPNGSIKSESSGSRSGGHSNPNSSGGRRR